MTNRVLFVALLGFFLLVLLAPSASFASAVDTSAADQALIEGSFAVGLVGGSLLGVYALLSAFRSVRAVLGVGGTGGVGADSSVDEVVGVRGFSSSQSYLDDLASRLAAEDAARGIDFRDVETGKTNLDYMEESGFAGEDIDRSQHSQAELDAYDRGLEHRSMAAEREEFFVVPVGVDSGADFDPLSGSGDAVYQDNLASVEFDSGDKSTYSASHLAAFDAGLSGNRDSEAEKAWGADEWMAFDAGRDAQHEALLASHGTSNAELSALKEVSKDHDYQAMASEAR